LQREQTLGSIYLLPRKEYIKMNKFSISGTTRFSTYTVMFLSQELNVGVFITYTGTLFYLTKCITLHSNTSFFAVSAAALSG
jgi:hypothetical protein